MFGWFIGRNKGFQPNTIPDMQLWLDATRIGVQGYSLDFDGTDDYVQANNVITAYPFTLECWVRLDVTNVSQRIIGISNTTANNIRYGVTFNVTSGKFAIVSQNTTSFQNDGTTSPSANVWYHVAGVFTSATDRTLYINGVSEATGTDNVTYDNTSNTVNMGRHFTTSFFLDGKLSDVRIWNTARTAQEIADNYQKRLIGNESGLVGYWKLDKGSGTTVADSTTNANAGTISGAIWDNSEPLTEAISDNTAVRVWADQSGKGYNATQSTTAARPTYIASGLNGLPVVRFDGTDDRLALGASALGMLRNVGGATIFSVIKYPGTSANQVGFQATNNTTSARLQLEQTSAGKNAFLARSLDAGTQGTATSTANSSSSFVIHSGWVNYPTRLLRNFINGGLDGSQQNTIAQNDTTSDTNSGFITIGANSGGFVALNGDIAEIIVYNRALNTSELAQVHRYLARKWGIALA